MYVFVRVRVRVWGRLNIETKGKKGRDVVRFGREHSLFDMLFGNFPNGYGLMKDGEAWAVNLVSLRCGHSW